MRYLNQITLTILFLVSSLYAGNVATITALKGEAYVQRDSQNISLKLGDKLQEKDTVVTKDKTKVQIIFKDETIISIGKNSNFSINEYLFEETKAPVARFGMLKGAMRVITGRIGKVAPEKFSVKTKTATMGIRGTNFTLIVGEDGSYKAYCTFGAISVKINGKEHIVQQGFSLSLSPSGEVEVKEFSPQDLKNMKKKNFARAKVKKSVEGITKTVANSGQIDNTKIEKTNIVIKDISDAVTDADQVAGGNAGNLATIIAGYTMSDALYNGTYHIISNSGDLAPNGTAKLEINFGTDNIKLTLDPVNTGLEYNTNSVLSGTSFSVGDGNGGTATGVFTGSSGNKVNGTMNADFGSGMGSGTYSVTSTQTLH